ncbi:HpcH/HpaI aldolase/citrate lyase family protein [Acrocarpospora pleiomorpha]|uniref:HpcH/HpaI aldolase/citrate lyase family protein n=1 Tax=Acrocarpospora pleiomorpha TaxID=90975 RepID=UPI0012D2E4AE|nr:aldolase/citrate lyase family protein [Acrocarpospora pleiomorpha]
MSAVSGRERFERMRSVLEVPILNEKFWSKVPAVAADAIMVDLEDSATPADKERARERVLAALEAPAHFGGRHVIVRVNNLDTPWGRDDLAELAGSPGDFLVCYPKAQSAAEIAEAMSILNRGTAARGLHVMIETARAVRSLDQIAGADGVQGLHFGYVDYAADVGSKVFDDDGADLYGPANHYARSAIAVAAAAHGLFATGGSLIPDYRDLAKVERFVRTWADVGYTGCIAVSPAHLQIINARMAPAPEDVRAAREVCDAYQQAVERGEPAAVLNGRAITLPDYRVASRLVARALPVDAKGA